MKKSRISLQVLTAAVGVILTIGSDRSLAARVASTGDPHVDFLVALAQRESSGRKSLVNQYGYLGLFQMGGEALNDANYYQLGPSGVWNAWDGVFSARAKFVDVVSKETYLQSAGAQELAVRAYHEITWQRITRLRLASAVGSEIGGVMLSQSGMIAGSHLVGIGGLAKFIRSGGTEVTKDGNGTSIIEYLTLFEGYY